VELLPALIDGVSSQLVTPSGAGTASAIYRTQSRRWSRTSPTTTTSTARSSASIIASRPSSASDWLA
jgi:hypothetical protein